MKKQFITAQMRELRDVLNKAEELSSKEELTKRDEQRINVLLARAAALRSGDIAPDDFSKRWWIAFIRNEHLPIETRGTDLLAGTQSITYTQGAAGGYLVPYEFHQELFFGLSQIDPLLDPDNVTLSVSKDTSLRPYNVPGWDLSTYAATKVAEGAQQTPASVPGATSAQLGSYLYKATLDASFEFEEDDFQPTYDQISAAYTIAFARGIGVDLVTGNGTTAPQGVLTGAANSGYTTVGAGAITATDIESIYFKLNAVYRNMPKCAWVMSDTIYQQIRKAADTNGRPLISVAKDKQILMGKPILISPTMPSTAGSTGIVLGDLSYYVVRASRMAVTRSIQAPGYAEKGKGLYTGRMRADAKVVDPTSGNTPPIIYATLHA